VEFSTETNLQFTYVLITMNDDHNEDQEPTGTISIFRQIQSMTIADKIQFAMHAGKEARSILIKDPNKQVAMAVLSSPKLNEDEVLLMAQSRNVSEDVLRKIAKNKDWTKKYPICLSLVNNPKTPIAIALAILTIIKTKDLALLIKNRNVPQALRSSASRYLKMRRQAT
jgi:hypothetical protein